MDSAKLNDWGQVVGIFALVVSLVFVVMQMRQTQEIAGATFYQMRSDSAREVGALMVENPSVIELYARAYDDGIDSLNPHERRRLVVSADTMLGHFENSHQLYQLGFHSSRTMGSGRRTVVYNFFRRVAK